MSEKTPSSWSLLKDDLHADCRIFEIRKQRFLRNSDRKQGDFFVLDTNDWVNVLALTSDDHLVRVRQFRYGTKDFSLEPPGGVVEDGEDPSLAGQRELLEETGYCGKNAEIIGSVSPNPAIMSNRCHFLLVREVEKTGEVSFDPNEELVTELVSVSDLKDLIRRGKITHSLAMNAIFQLLLEIGKTP